MPHRHEHVIIDRDVYDAMEALLSTIRDGGSRASILRVAKVVEDTIQLSNIFNEQFPNHHIEDSSHV
jgi:hypothetical protein